MEIKELLKEDTNRTTTLEKQQNLFEKKIERYQQLIHTINISLDYSRKGEIMDNKLMFKGLQSKEEWQNALEDQVNHLKEKYNFDLNTTNIDVDRMNLMAIEAQNFTDKMAELLRTEVKYDDIRVQKVVYTHLQFLNNNGYITSKEDFVNQTKFFLQDDFHRGMLEHQQIGLAYYLVTVAENL